MGWCLLAFSIVKSFLLCKWMSFVGRYFETTYMACFASDFIIYMIMFLCFPISASKLHAQSKLWYLIWPARFLWNWLLCSFDVFSFFFEALLSFWSKMFGVVLVLNCPNPGMSHFLWRALVPVSQETYLEAELYQHEDSSAVRSSQWAELENTHAYNLTAYGRPWGHSRTSCPVQHHSACSVFALPGFASLVYSQKPASWYPWSLFCLVSLISHSLKDALLTSSWFSGCWARPHHGRLPHPA